MPLELVAYTSPGVTRSTATAVTSAPLGAGTGTGFGLQLDEDTYARTVKEGGFSVTA
jgi:hypothetical protein